MTLEYLAEKKTQYEKRYNHFKGLEFDILATDFKDVVDLISEMEEYVKEKENGNE